MKRLSSMALREKCSQFVFCSSRFLTLSVTFPSPCPYILAPCPFFLESPTLALHYTAPSHPTSITPPYIASLHLLPSLLLCHFNSKTSFIRSVIGHKTCQITSHKGICVREMTSVSPRLLTSSVFSLLFCDNAESL